MAAPKKSAAKTEQTAGNAGTLDRSKTFYEVIGGGAVKFQQGDNLYDTNGNQVDLDGNPVAGKVATKAPEAESVVAEAAPAGETKTDGMTEDELAALSGGK